MFFIQVTARLTKYAGTVVVFLSSLTVLFLTGVGLGKEPYPAPVIEAIPQRIVSLAPSVTETLFALGAGDRLVGVTTYSNYPPQAQRIAKVGSFVKPSLEAVLAKQPDLVVGVPGGADREQIKRMKRLGLRVLVIPSASLGDLFSSIRFLARVVGRQEAGEKLLQRIRAQINQVKTTIAGTQPRRVLMVVGLHPLVAVGKGTFIDEILTLAGGENIAGAAPPAWPHLPIEYVIAKAPQVIIEGGTGSERGELGKHWADLKSIPAVKEGRIYSYFSDKILRPGPRVGEALKEIAQLIHPECFSHPRGKQSKKGGCEGS